MELIVRMHRWTVPMKKDAEYGEVVRLQEWTSTPESLQGPGGTAAQTGGSGRDAAVETREGMQQEAGGDGGCDGAWSYRWLRLEVELPVEASGGDAQTR